MSFEKHIFSRRISIFTIWQISSKKFLCVYRFCSKERWEIHSYFACLVSCVVCCVLSSIKLFIKCSISLIWTFFFWLFVQFQFRWLSTFLPLIKQRVLGGSTANFFAFCLLVVAFQFLHHRKKNLMTTFIKNKFALHAPAKVKFLAPSSLWAPRRELLLSRRP